jgi:4-hydroxy-tetrahydrodipicolinate synthase
MTDLGSSALRSLLHGLWLPLITPFRDGILDEVSLRRLVRHYAALPIDGLILAATSGEGLTLGMAELEWIVELARSEAADTKRYMPICLGLSGSHTRKMCQTLDETAAWPIDGYLIASPYYSRPSQAACFSISARSRITPAGRSCSTTFPTAPRSILRTRRCSSSLSIRTSSA